MTFARGPLAAALFLFAVPVASGAPSQVPLCESCHGPAGNSGTQGVPSIAGHPVTYLENQMVLFREGSRHAPVMQGVLKGYKDEDLTALARHFSAQKVRAVSTGPTDKALAARGEALASKMHCGQCHLPTYHGQNQMPRLAGQREDYLVEEMIAYRDNKRTGADTMMMGVMHGVSDADIRALAHFLSRKE